MIWDYIKLIFPSTNFAIIRLTLLAFCYLVVPTGARRCVHEFPTHTKGYSDTCCNTVCKILKTEAMCESRGCTCVPKDLDQDIRILSLSHNHLNRLDSSEFAGYAELKNLSVNYNNISIISSKAFYGLIKLIYLDLANNPITELVDFFFSPMPLLEWIDLSFTYISQFNAKAFINVTNLQKFSMRGCGLLKIPNFQTDLRTNSLPSINLKELDLEKNRIDSLQSNDFINYPNLETLMLRNNEIYDIKAYTFKNLKRLVTLDLSFDIEIKYTEHSFDNPNLKTLRLDDSKFQFKKGNNFFWNLPSLESLSLDRSKVRNSGLDDIQPNPLAKLSNLKFLGMQGMTLKDQWVETFLQNLTSLSYIDFTNNHVRQLNKNMFKYIPRNATQVLFAANKITKVLRYHLPDWLWHAKYMKWQVLNLISNPFNCDCDILWLKRWINETHIDGMLSATTEYLCFTPPDLNGKLIRNLTSISVVSCFSSLAETSIRIYVTMVTSVVTYIVVAMVAFVHKYRWHARYFIFVYKNKWRQMREQNEGTFEYDAFVSYCAADRHWVVEHIVDFENKAQLKFCFHDRDWEVGRYIMENILDSMRASRRLIFIVSNAFCESTWCQDELQLAHSQLVETNLDSVIMILIEQLNEDSVTETLRFYLNRTYIEWPSSEAAGRNEGIELFWMRLRKSIGDRVVNKDLVAANQAYAIQIQQQ